MTPDAAIREAETDKLRPVYLLVGEERVFVDRVISALRGAVLEPGSAGLNEEMLTAGDVAIERVMTSLRVAPMLGRRRFVLVRALERWDAAGEKSKAATQRAQSAMDRLTAYAAAPLESTCLVLAASKLDKRRKLPSQARSKGFLVTCDPVSRQALPRFVERETRSRGHEMAADVAELIAEIAGPELGSVLDAVERLSLFAGAGQPITEDAVAACITRIRPSTVWELVGAVGKRDPATALAVLFDVYDPHDRGLRLVGVLAWSVRQLIKFSSALRGGARPDEAAKIAGAPPFRARELSAQVRHIPEGELERWLSVLSETDLALKGSRRPPRTVLESAILTMTIGLPR